VFRGQRSADGGPCYAKACYFAKATKHETKGRQRTEDFGERGKVERDVPAR